jgi:plastocyanin
MARMRRWTVAGATAALGVWIAAGSAFAADTAVTIADFAFAPGSVTIQVGDTVTFTNQDGTAHTARAVDGSFDTGDLGGGEASTITFGTAGTFDYMCAIHPQMTGTVVVAAASDGGGAAITPAPTDTLAPMAIDADHETRLVAATLAILGAVMIVGTFVADRRFRSRGD